MIVVDHECRLSPMECCLQHVMGLARPEYADELDLAASLRSLDKGAFGKRSGVEWNRRMLGTRGQYRVERKG